MAYRVNRTDLLRLAASAVRAGALPSDPTVPASSTMPRDLTCALCGEALGTAPAFTLLARGTAFLLHAPCFSAWIDVVVTPSQVAQTRRGDG
jgi:hypothetical protein